MRPINEVICLNVWNLATFLLDIVICAGHHTKTVISIYEKMFDIYQETEPLIV